MNVLAAYAPLFDGQPIFGDLSSFEVTKLVQGRARDVDTFLGLTPGTRDTAPAPPMGSSGGSPVP